MLKYLRLQNVGPAAQMELKLGERLNIITGDNGLGKSFLLDLAWFVSTGSWPAEVNPRLLTGGMALPLETGKPSKIDFLHGTARDSNSFSFSSFERYWEIHDTHAPYASSVLIYFMADGSCAVFDPYRNKPISRSSLPAFIFNPSQVWNGLPAEKDSWYCNGLIRDWASWQKEGGSPFAVLKAILSRLSPSDQEPIVPGGLTRISVEDVRDMPSITMPYGESVAAVHASAGIRRILTIAYLLVWTWEEHLKASKLRDSQPLGNVLLLVDEVEAHLHPKWQRVILPSLLNVVQDLAGSPSLQALATTHSPLVMASLEPHFDAEKDAWFDLDLSETPNAHVVLTQREFENLGDANDWLMSDAFDLNSSRSVEAEALVEKAARLLDAPDSNKEALRAIQVDLIQQLNPTDPFLRRWNYIVEKKNLL